MSQPSTTNAPLVSDCIEHATDDVENLFNDAAGEHWELEYLQLTPGPLKAWYRIVPLPDMTISWYRCGAALHVREYHQHDGVYLSFMPVADAPFKWRGIELMPDQALLYLPGIDHDYVLPGNVRFMGFMLSDRLIRRMGWHIRHDPVLSIGRFDYRSLAAEAARVTDAVWRGVGPSDEGLQVMQERLALRLDELMAAGGNGSGARPVEILGPDRMYLIAESARQEMLHMGLSEKLDVRRLADRLSTSTRSLYRAFRHCYGVGPYEYHTLMRFRAFRRLMRSSEIYPGVITDLAMERGFMHLGRFASAYRKQYGELPRETLRRWLQVRGEHAETDRRPRLGVRQGMPS